MAREHARRPVPGAILHDDDLEPAEGVLLPEKALDRPLDGRFRIACGNDHADGGHPLQRVVPRCWCHVMSEARARPPSGERRVGLLRDKPTHGTCQVGNDAILLGFLSAPNSSPAAIVNAADTHEARSCCRYLHATVDAGAAWRMVRTAEVREDCPREGGPRAARRAFRRAW